MPNLWRQKLEQEKGKQIKKLKNGGKYKKNKE